MTTTLELSSFRAPVTALALIRGVLLIGEGPFLRLYSQETCAAYRIFGSQSIHGIIAHQLLRDEVLLLLWGGRHISIQLAKFDARNGLSPLKNERQIETSDWILDLAIHDTRANDRTTIQAAALTAHNGLYVLDVKLDVQPHDGSQTLHLQHHVQSADTTEVSSGSRCILYSAHVKWIDEFTLLLASGTAFGEIIVWSASIRSIQSADLLLHYVFTGHEGSIFGVTISDALDDVPFGGHRRLLASCSDDRSIRIWDLSTYRDHILAHDPNGILDALRDRETGFGANSESLGFIASSPSSLATAWGHLSRIWGVHIVGSERGPDASLRMVSVGEDATSQLWGFPASSGNIAPPLRHLGSSALHTGKNIWSSIVQQVDDSSIGLISGGADGAVYSDVFIHSAHGTHTSTEQQKPFDVLKGASERNTLAESQHTTSASSTRTTEPVFRTYSFVTPQCLIATATSGDIIKGMMNRTQSSASRMTWTYVGSLPSLKSYAVSTSIPAFDLALFGAADGAVYYYRTRLGKGVRDLVKVQGKISDIFATPIPSRNGSTRFGVILGMLGLPRSQYLTLREDQVTGCLYVESQTSLPPVGRGVVVTSFENAKHASKGDILVLGTRNGSVVILEPHSSEDAPYGHQVLAIVDKVHDDAVTSMIWLEAMASQSRHAGSLVSVGRDGHCSFLRFAHDMTYTLTHRLSLPFGPSIEGIYQCPNTFELLAYGFHGKHFKVFNLHTEREHMSVECGGAHRQWAFQPADPDPNTSVGAFAWTRASDFNIHFSSPPKHVCMQAGGHGRDTKAVAITKSPFRRFGHLITTGAEDTDIMLSTDSSSAAEGHMTAPMRLQTIRRHITGIQDVMWLELNDSLAFFSSGGCEEFFVWRVREVPILGLGVVCEAQMPIPGGRSDLRIMGFDVRRLASEDKGVEFACKISMVLSDSAVRLYHYSSARVDKFQLIASTTYLATCHTQCSFLDSERFLTASTNGHVALWSAPPDAPHADKAPQQTDSITLQTHIRIHQSAIKSISYLHLPAHPTTTLLLTAGDDNALGFTLLHNPPTTNTPQAVSNTLLIPSAHAAAVTACKLISTPPSPNVDSNNSDFRCVALTVSNDQRFKIWDISINQDRLGEGVGCIDVNLREDISSMIADANCLDVVPVGGDGKEVKAMICGVGMEEWVLDVEGAGRVEA